MRTRKPVNRLLDFFISDLNMSWLSPSGRCNPFENDEDMFMNDIVHVPPPPPPPPPLREILREGSSQPSRPREVKVEDSEATEDDDRGGKHGGDMEEEGEDDTDNGEEVPVETFYEKKLRLYREKYYVKPRTLDIPLEPSYLDTVLRKDDDRANKIFSLLELPRVRVCNKETKLKGVVRPQGKDKAYYGKRNLGKKIDMSTMHVVSENPLHTHKRKRDEPKLNTMLVDEHPDFEMSSPLRGVVNYLLDARVQKDLESVLKQDELCCWSTAMLPASRPFKGGNSCSKDKYYARLFINKTNFQKVVQVTQANADRYAIHLDMIDINPKTLRHYETEDEDNDDLEDGETDLGRSTGDVGVREEYIAKAPENSTRIL
ncbi:hypothetical protein GIB67_028265 [Kingdonia uniflora]|uniref:Uncharacterized protein n=1 Tax=Kingdonia uniflora TaxID=39325 RepID=A0A7J7KZJ2_9MAGN|nr:hypothetical protein GIB67_028265 [Kingdonia uniflora]